MAASTIFLLNFVLTITNSFGTDNVSTRVVHRMFAMVPLKMVEDDDFARARMQFVLDQMHLAINDEICAKIMKIVRAVLRGRCVVEVAHVPHATICVTLDHGAVTSIDTEFEDEVDDVAAPVQDNNNGRDAGDDGDQPKAIEGGSSSNN